MQSQSHARDDCALGQMRVAVAKRHLRARQTKWLAAWRYRLDLINNFNSFALVYTLTGGGPGGKTMLPSLFVYKEAFQFGHWGYAAAMGNVMVMVVGTFLVLYLWGNRRAVR